ncbi:hypothetical protein ACIOWI_34780 [Streptomyces sp. NPDC087659]|uniref:scabin-related ADP-ribosyltransferase n=1 Tax=Streptomyces sp. NPDC087659 TaxID=3365801 RepID=UPI003803B1B7
MEQEGLKGVERAGPTRSAPHDADEGTEAQDPLRILAPSALAKDRLQDRAHQSWVDFHAIPHGANAGPDHAPAVNWNLVHPSDRDRVVLSQPGEILWRFSKQPPGQVFRNGFKARDVHKIANFLKHVTAKGSDYQYVSTTRDPNLWFGSKRYRYRIDTRKNDDQTGVEVIASGLGKLTSEREIAFTDRIDPAAVTMVYDRWLHRTGYWNAETQSLEWLQGERDLPDSAQSGSLSSTHTIDASASEVQDPPWPTPVQDLPGFTHIGDWALVRPEIGSKPGGIYLDGKGNYHYVKKAPSADYARNEVLAARLYALAGVAVPTKQLVVLNGQPATASRFIEDAEPDAQDRFDSPQYRTAVQAGFATDAWLAAAEPIGYNYKNLVNTPDGMPIRIATSAALLNKGDFNPDVDQWDDFRSLPPRDGCFYFFKDMTDEQMRESAKGPVNITAQQIDTVVDSVGFTDDLSTHLKHTLKQRQASIAAQAGIPRRLTPTPHPLTDEKPSVSLVEGSVEGGSARGLELLAGQVGPDADPPSGISHRGDAKSRRDDRPWGSGEVSTDRWIPFGEKHTYKRKHNIPTDAESSLRWLKRFRGRPSGVGAFEFVVGEDGVRRVVRPPGSGERTDIGYSWEWHRGISSADEVLHLARRLHLVGVGVSADGLQEVKDRLVEELDTLVNIPGYRLPALQPDQVTGPALPGPLLKVTVEFTRDPADAHAVVQVHPGRPRKDTGEVMDQAVWYADMDPAAFVHEVVHGLGVRDDQPDRRVLLTPGGRNTQQPADGTTSLMGTLTHPRQPPAFTLTPDHLQQITDTLTPHLHHTTPAPTTPNSTPTHKPHTTVHHAPTAPDHAPAVNWNLVHPSDRDRVVLSQPGEILWRFSKQPPAQVFRNGFKARDVHNIASLVQHEGAEGSNYQYVSTTRDPNLWFEGKRYRYRIDTRKNGDRTGIDVNASLPNDLVLSHEQEVAFTDRIDSAAVTMVYDDRLSRTGIWNRETHTVDWRHGEGDLPTSEGAGSADHAHPPTGWSSDTPQPPWPTPAQDFPGFTHIGDWTLVGPEIGSKPGGIYLDGKGNYHYVKKAPSADYARNEVLAARLYALSGVAVPTKQLVVLDGQPATASRFIEDAESDAPDLLDSPQYLAAVQAGFATDAWLAAEEPIGWQYENLVTTHDGMPIRIDTSATLLYHSQGAPKGSLFGVAVGEWSALRNESGACHSADFFEGMTDEQLRESAWGPLNVTAQQIDITVDSVGFTDDLSAHLKQTLRQRQASLAAQAGIPWPLTQTPAPAPDSRPGLPPGWNTPTATGPVPGTIGNGDDGPQQFHTLLTSGGNSSDLADLLALASDDMGELFHTRDSDLAGNSALRSSLSGLPDDPPPGILPPDAGTNPPVDDEGLRPVPNTGLHTATPRGISPQQDRKAVTEAEATSGSPYEPDAPAITTTRTIPVKTRYSYRDDAELAAAIAQKYADSKEYVTSLPGIIPLDTRPSRINAALIDWHRNGRKKEFSPGLKNEITKAGFTFESRDGRWWVNAPRWKDLNRAIHQYAGRGGGANPSSMPPPGHTETVKVSRKGAQAATRVTVNLYEALHVIAHRGVLDLPAPTQRALRNAGYFPYQKEADAGGNRPWRIRISQPVSPHIGETSPANSPAFPASPVQDRVMAELMGQPGRFGASPDTLPSAVSMRPESAGRQAAQELGESGSALGIVALPPTTWFDAWNAFAEQSEELAGELLALTRSKFPPEVGDMDDAVKQAYALLSPSERRLLLHQQADLLVNQALEGRRYLLDAGADAAVQTPARNEAAGPSSAAGSSDTQSVSELALLGAGDRETVRRLLEVLHSRARIDLLGQESEYASLGPDLFGLRGEPEPPAFLKDFDYQQLTPEGMAPFLATISMTRPAPEPGTMPPAQSFTGGNVLTVRKETPEEQSWGTSPYPNARPDELTIPLNRTAIWLGSPLGDTDDPNAFRNTLTTSTRILAAEGVTTTLFTDLPRTLLDQARTTPAPSPGTLDPLADIRSMLTWATTEGIHLVNINDCFNTRNPLKLRGPYETERAKQTGNGYAAASDILRLLIMIFGFYNDGDEEVSSGSIAEVKDGLSTRSFVLAGVDQTIWVNSTLIAPAGHWYPEKYIDTIHQNYTRKQEVLYNRTLSGDDSAPAWDYLKSSMRSPTWRQNRNSTFFRTGPINMPVIVRSRESDPPYFSREIRNGVAASWVDDNDKSVKREAVLPDEEEVARRVIRIAATLIRGLYNREGDLRLTEVAPVVERLPDPSAAWEAVLSFIAQTPHLAERIRTITRHKLSYIHDNPITVTLPPSVLRLLAFDETAAERARIGILRSGETGWLLGEVVEPARFLQPGQAPGPDLSTSKAAAMLAEYASPIP